MKKRVVLLSICLFGMCLCLCACTFNSGDNGGLKRKTPLDSVLLDKTLSGEIILGRIYSDHELPEEDLFGLTDEMRTYAEQIAHDTGGDVAANLHSAFFKPVSQGGRGFVYDPYASGTAAKGFTTRRVNCLTYTLLYVEMARYLGLKAEYNEVMIPPTWGMRSDNTYVFMRHVNARVYGKTKGFLLGNNINYADTGMFTTTDTIIDLEMRRYRPYFKQKTINNREIAAQYYSNMGLDLIAERKEQIAFFYLRKALLMKDNLSYIWSNFASLYFRLGYFKEAEVIFLHGLRINPRDFTIMHNLAGLYAQTGQMELSHFYQQRVQGHRDNNPYYIYNLARDAVDVQDYQKAARLIDTAIAKEKEEIIFYQLAITIYDELKIEKKANKMRDKAFELSRKKY
jgi:tetratricopeptide (TPR) repeat protein